jgi:hypothetical protein
MTAPTAFQCQSCALELDLGTSATLVAVPSSGARFTGWQGACSGTGACVVTLNAAKSVTATFGKPTFRVSVSVTGKGKVVSAPAGLSCPRRCSATFQANSKVKLRPQPAAGYLFVGWSGSCRGKGTCVVTTSRDRSARATFRKQG